MKTQQVIEGRCHCGSLSVAAALAGAPESYRPRACDCDFCRKHGASYLSDPEGRLRLVVSDPAAISRYRQGSGQADMLFCGHCGVLVGACYREDQRLYGAVNTRIFTAVFGDEVAVSPQQLAPGEKTLRWADLWFPDVVIEELQEH